MASLHLHQIDDDLVRRLEARAAAHGRSAEAEVRAILEAALPPQASARTGRELWERLARGEARLEPDEFKSSVDQTPRPADFS